MPVYTYQVRDQKSGKVTKGKLAAENMSLVRQRLAESGLVVLQIREQSGLASFANFNIGGNKVKRKDVAIFARQFSTMIEAGLPITKSLTILAAQSESPSLSCSYHRNPCGYCYPHFHRCNTAFKSKNLQIRYPHH